VDRRTTTGCGAVGVCGETDRLRLAVAGLHFGEEPPLTGGGGSGTIFITGCALRCPFCQNWQISRCGRGREVDEAEFVALARRLQAEGAENLNLVTPSHMAPTLVRYLRSAKNAGINLPVIWNSSAYESVETVDIAASAVDIWLPDLKTLDAAAARRIYGVPDYPSTATAAILRMADSEDRMTRGLIVRHLVIPGEIPSTLNVIGWFARELSGRARLSLMTQYTPVRIPGENRSIPQRPLCVGEYETVVEALEKNGVVGYYQELVKGNDWLPDFDRPNPFGSDLSTIVWRHDTGFVSPVR
jgi:putative pyruvate formate lyase activating enzyme